MRFSTTLARFPEAMLLTDATAAIAWANQAACAMTGWSRGELRGLPLEHLISHEELKWIAETRGGGDLRALERYHCFLKMKGGAQREVSVSVGHVSKRESDPAIYMLRDIRRQREVQGELMARLTAKKELEAFGRTASLIVHDLRGLNGVLAMMTRNFKHHLEDPAYRAEAVTTLQAVLAQITELISKMFSPRLQDGLRRERVCVGDIVRDALDLAASAGRCDEVKATELVGFEEPLDCEVDQAQMTRLLFNILVNAYEADEGKARVTVRGVDAAPDEVRLEVEDSGPGMSADYLDNCLFQPFRSTKPHGLGLALYQAKWLIEAHGGKIHVANRQDARGVRVTMTLPKPAIEKLQG